MGLFLLVLGAKWMVVLRFGSAIPEWDQWDAEGLHLFLPWSDNHLTLAELFLPHNEHRIVLTKLWSLNLLILNGQWDTQVECTANTVLHGSLAVGLFLLGRRHFPGRWQAVLFLLLAGFFALPLAWQNNLGGFHSQQYFLLGLSFLAIRLLPGAVTGSRKWWLGMTATALAILSMGSGFFAAAAILVLLALAWWRDRMPWREILPTAAVCTFFCAIGWLTRVEVNYHASLKAQSVHDFVESTLHSLQWPALWSTTLALLVWLPWILMGWRAVRKIGNSEDGGDTLLGLGGWVLLQILATAYTRGAGGSPLASRYLDTLGFGVLVNGICLGFLIQTSTGLQRRIRQGLAPLWILVVAAGVFNVAKYNLTADLPSVRTYLGRAEEHVRSYLATGNVAHLEAGDIPYPSKDALIERITHPGLRALLPAVVRLPLPVQASTRESVFVRVEELATPPASGGPSPLGRPFWSTYGRDPGAGPAAWESTTFTTSISGYLQFRVAGSGDAESIGLEIRDGRTGRAITAVELGEPVGDRWRTAYVRLPAGSYFLEAHDRDPQRWLAFTQPVEVGRLSYWTPRLLRQGPFVAMGGATLAFLALAFGWISACPPGGSRTESPPSA